MGEVFLDDMINLRFLMNFRKRDVYKIIGYNSIIDFYRLGRFKKFLVLCVN